MCVGRRESKEVRKKQAMGTQVFLEVGPDKAAGEYGVM